ncbi:MAG TPA: hypothetical protein PKK23_17910 [Nitrospirales bacterium]|nr:hypothetical protein [Nitrospirales bacterium]
MLLPRKHTPKQSLAEAYRTNGHQMTDLVIAEAMGMSMLFGEQIVGTSLSGGGTDGSLPMRCVDETHAGLCRFPQKPTHSSVASLFDELSHEHQVIEDQIR